MTQSGPTETWTFEILDGLPAMVRRRDDGTIAEANLFEGNEAPAVAAALIRKGRPQMARSLIDAWFVSIANAAGFTNFVLGP